MPSTYYNKNQYFYSWQVILNSSITKHCQSLDQQTQDEERGRDSRAKSKINDLPVTSSTKTGAHGRVYGSALTAIECKNCSRLTYISIISGGILQCNFTCFIYLLYLGNCKVLWCIFIDFLCYLCLYSGLGFQKRFFLHNYINREIFKLR